MPMDGSKGDVNLRVNTHIKGKSSPSHLPWAFLVAQRIKSLPAVWEIGVRSLGWEDPLEKEIVTHRSILAWRIPKDRGACWAIVHSVSKS